MKSKSLLAVVLGLGLILILSVGIVSLSNEALAQKPVVQGETGVLDVVGTAFTYQGRLLDNGTPVDGACDFQFNLYDDVWLSPSLIAGPVDRGNVTVSDGYFHTGIDFGADAFTGEGRQLQILVRCPAGSGSYTTLSGMVWLTAAPYAHSLRPGATISSDTAGELGAVLYVEDTYSGMFASSALEGKSTQGTAVYGESLSSTGVGVEGKAASTGKGVRGETFSGYGVYGEATASSGVIYGVYGKTNSSSGHSVHGEATAASGTAYGVYGKADSSEGVGVYGEATTVDTLTGVVAYGGRFVANGAFDIGVYGESSFSHAYWPGYGGYFTTASGDGAGVYGKATHSEGGYGVQGESSNGTGVYGKGTSINGSGGRFQGHDAGYASPDVRLSGGWGVLVADENSDSSLSLLSYDDIRLQLDYNRDDGDSSFEIYDPNYHETFPVWQVDQDGNTQAVGTKSAVVDTQDYGRRKLHAMESPGVWFEDFGAGTLVNGGASISIEPVFAKTVNLEDYHVFLTPLGDCKGLYVAAKTPTSFEVRELAGGTSNISFDYRVIARRLGYEDVRLEEAGR